MNLLSSIKKNKLVLKLLQPKTDYIIIILIIILTGLGVYSNIYQQKAQDNSKLPSKIEEDGGYQRWIKNLKNKGFKIEAEEFILTEEEQIYNTKWINIKSIDDKGIEEYFNQTINDNKNIDKIIYSPSDRSFLDYRNIVKTAVSPEGNFYQPYEVRFFGIRDSKLIEARILECYNKANCYFDRAYFLSNDVFVVSEFSLEVKNKDSNDYGNLDIIPCNIDQFCEYTIKIHLLDLVNNSKKTYESNTKQINLLQTIPEL